jgi:hypothetical protein
VQQNAVPRKSRGRRALQPAGFDVLNQLWESLRSLWSEEGCGIDPNGRCVQPPATINTDTGCNIDPNGRCMPGLIPQPPATIKTDEGCHIDPSGRCRS